VKAETYVVSMAPPWQKRRMDPSIVRDWGVTRVAFRKANAVPISEALSLNFPLSAASN
jgi:DNA-directed RNA polymerase